ncbi:MAG: hypothetical protein AAF386_04010, partial [Pseudomonadota bacterium]
MENRILRVRPLRYSSEHQEFKFNTDAGLNEDSSQDNTWFEYPTPGPQNTTKPKVHQKTELGGLHTETNSKADLPAGWERVSKADLNAYQNASADTKFALQWFQGGQPTWQGILSSGVGLREDCEKIENRLSIAHTTAIRPSMTLVTGAGGEGKSSAIMQIAGKLVQSNSMNWTCLRRRVSAAPLSRDLLNTLNQAENHSWLIILDDAENTIRGNPEEQTEFSLTDLMSKLALRTDVQVLLAARDADWRVLGGNRVDWDAHCDFSMQPLSKLTSIDAKRIVDGWAGAGADGTGKMHGIPTEKAASLLLQHAREEATQGEGSLLGGLLIVREGEDLRKRVGNMIRIWNKADGIGQYSLLHIYEMVAVMHANNQLYLTTPVLAKALGCTPNELESGPLRILRTEAMLESGTGYLLTRHRVIAETACSFLKEQGRDPRKWLTVLAIAAARFKSDNPGTDFPEIKKWRIDLPNHFTNFGDETNREYAVLIAKQLFTNEKTDPKRLTVYASTLRRCGRTHDAFELLSNEIENHHSQPDVLT